MGIALVGVACATNSSSSDSSWGDKQCATCNGRGIVHDKGLLSSGWDNLFGKTIFATEEFMKLIGQKHEVKECPDCDGLGELVSSSASSDSSSSSSPSASS